MKSYRANYSLYVPQLGVRNWAPVETVYYQADFKAATYIRAHEIALILQPPHTELTAVIER